MRDLIRDALPASLSQDDVASRLHMSPRTLHRRLDEEGASFRGIKEALRHDFLQISDHDRLADYACLDTCGLVLIVGEEVSARSPGDTHVLNIGGSEHVPSGNSQDVIDRVNATGGLPVLCHPDWGPAFDHVPARVLAGLRNYAGVEIFNGGTHWDTGNGMALGKWDMLLSSGQPFFRNLWGFANDDAHALDGIGLGWNVVFAADRSQRAIVDALRRGAFYASTGVTIESIECSGSVLTIVAPDAEAIAIQGEQAKRFAFVEGTRLTFDASALGALTAPYIRVDCFGRGERRAWTQPIWLTGPAVDRLQALLADKPVLRVSCGWVAQNSQPGGR